jgi:saccharopine dehydrogenase-like NADP-dependent oxidoreductase
MMARSVVEILSKYKDTHITIASNIIETAQDICKAYPDCTSAEFVDIFNPTQLCALVAKSDHVVSYIPPAFHMEVVNACLKESKNLISSSYISPAIEATDKEWKEKGLICLKECGLDPGIDIMSTIKVRDEAKEEGVKIVGYESYCGGMPAAEHIDNPLGYKFTWNPGAAIKASKNVAIFKKDGQ